MNFNTNAAMGAALGALSLYYITGKKPPQWLALLSLGVGIVSVVTNTADMFRPQVPNNINGLGCADYPKCLQ